MLSKKRKSLPSILKIGIAALTLLLNACTTAPLPASTLPLPPQTELLPTLQSKSSPTSIPEGQPLSPSPATEFVIPTPPTVAVAIEPTPIESTAQPEYYQSVATYYAKRFAGRRTTSGERYDPELMTAATRDFPLQSWLKVINPANGREVIVRVNDRTGKRKTPLIDLSRTAAKQLGFLGQGKIRVHIIPVSPPPSSPAPARLSQLTQLFSASHPEKTTHQLFHPSALFGDCSLPLFQ
jgi:rare lipoprotein A